MFSSSVPAKHGWNLPTRDVRSAIGFAAGANYTPYLDAHVYDTASGSTANFQPATAHSAGVYGISTRKQGGYIAVCTNTDWSIYPFNSSTGFGSRTDYSLSNARAVRFSPDGTLLAVASTSSVSVYSFSSSGLGSLITTLSSGVSSITDIHFSYDNRYLGVAGGGGTVLELFRTGNWSQTPLTCPSTPTAAGLDSYDTTWANPQGNYGWLRLSGVCANGYSYYAYQTQNKVLYGTVSGTGLSAPSSITFTKSWYNLAPYGIDFAPEQNFLFVGHSTEENGKAPGPDLRIFALSNTLPNLVKENSVTLGYVGSGDGGMPFNIAYMPTQKVLAMGSNDGYSNTRAYWCFSVSDAGAFTEELYPTGLRDTRCIDWF
jgi:WD40 repeat protein